MSRVIISETPDKNSRGETISHLVINDVIWMTNDDIEYEDIDRALKTAHGDCYIGGLGLGTIAVECSKIPQVNSILVVENDEGVLQLVVKDILLNRNLLPEQKRKLNFILGNATKDFYDRRYNWMYFDTWLEPNKEGKEMMEECFRAALPHLEPNGTLEAWMLPRLSGKEPKPTLTLSAKDKDGRV